MLCDFLCDFVGFSDSLEKIGQNGYWTFIYRILWVIDATLENPKKPLKNQS
jgi:hypothetical protein